MKIKSAHGKKDNYGKILEEYFYIVPLEMFHIFQDFLFDERLSLEQKTAHYEQAKSDILKLKDLFRQRTIELNKRVKKEGYLNYIEAFLSWNQIPKDKYESFLNNIDSFISLVINDEVPIKILMEREKDWNVFNTPYPLGFQRINDVFEIPNQVIDLISRYDQRIIQYKVRIIISFDDEDFYSSAYYNNEKDIVEIRLKRRRNDIYKTLDFVHHIGYAFAAFELADKGENPHSIPQYVSQDVGVQYSMKFLKNYISDDHQKVLRYNLLASIAETLFEIDIFSDNQQDYDKAYAKAVSRCYSMTHQIKNPFYVFSKRFILRPMGDLISTMIAMELYLKDAGIPQKSNAI